MAAPDDRARRELPLECPPLSAPRSEYPAHIPSANRGPGISSRAACRHRDPLCGTSPDRPACICPSCRKNIRQYSPVYWADGSCTTGIPTAAGRSTPPAGRWSGTHKTAPSEGCFHPPGVTTPCGPYKGGTHCPTFSARRCAAPARRSGGYFFVPCRSAPFVRSRCE